MAPSPPAVPAPSRPPASEEPAARLAHLEAELARAQERVADLESALAAAVSEQTTLGAMVDAIGEGVAILDRGFTIVYQNQAHRALAGAHAGEICHQARFGRQTVCDNCPLVATFADGGSHSLEQEVQGDLAPRLLEITTSPLKAGDGSVVAGIKTVRDVTARRRMEDALRRAVEAEKLLSSLSSRFLNLRPGEFEIAVEDSLETLGRVLGADRAQIVLLPGYSTWVASSLVWQRPELADLAGALPEVPSAGALPWLFAQLHQEQMVTVTDPDKLPAEAAAERQAFARAGIRSAIVLPLGYRGQLVGLFQLDFIQDSHAFSEEEARFLRVVAEVMANAAAHRRADEEAHRRSDHLEKLLIISTEITAGAEPAALCQRIAILARDLLNLDGTTVSIRRSSGADLELTAVAGMDPQEAAALTLSGLPAHAVASRRPVVSASLAAGRLQPLPVALTDLGMEAGLASPMLVESEVVGILAGYTRRARQFTAEEVALYQTIANQAAVALRNAVHLQALRESEEKYRILMATASDAIFMTDAETGVIMDINRKAAELIGLSPALLVGQPQRQLHPPPVRPAFDGLCRRAVATGRAEAQSLAMIVKEGRMIPVDVSASVTEVAGRRIIQSIYRDMSARHEAERDKEHIQAQLLQAQKMEAIGTLAGGVAHDFNNILTAIIGYSGLLLHRLPAGDPLRQEVVSIRTAGERGAALTRRLLAFSRKQATSKAVCDLNLLVEGVSGMLRRLIGEDIELATRCDAERPHILADAGQIEQILMNLAVNARDAMPRGGHLSLRTANVAVDRLQAARLPKARPGSFVTLEVRDTGIGMDPETIAHIFEPFFTTKGIGDGTGLGLAVVYGIVEGHEGWIEVESLPQEGTVFTVFLPAHEPLGPAAREERFILPDLKGHGERLLLVEDETMVRQFGAEALRANGYQVEEAVAVRDALDRFQAAGGEFDLVLIDVVLPDGSGLVLRDYLASERPGVKILMNSGYADQRSQTALIERLGLPFLKKPFSVVELLRAVRAVLSRPAPGVAGGSE
ncbi:MAG: GAF domain-containing protein [Thermodesulfobacteriota bacterium]